MKRKELKNLAMKIVKLEKELSSCTDTTRKGQIENEIVALSGKVTSIADMIAIDDMVQEILSEA